LGWLVLALVALVNGGCLLAAAGAAGAGAAAAAGYLYYNGNYYRDYHSNSADTLAAVRTSLAELQFPIREQQSDTGSATIKTRTNDGHTVHISLDMVPSPIPIEGTLTRVSVHVGYSGDEVVSARILDQVSRHLVPGTLPTAPPPAAPPANGAALGTPRPLPETPPPPLAKTSR
jgi:hypothetical protein